MDDRLVDWLTSASPTQFLVITLAMTLGSKKILSARNVSESFGGILLPVRWAHGLIERKAQEEAQEELDAQSTAALQHEYILWVTAWARSVEIQARVQSCTLPEPFQSFIEWKGNK